MPPFSVPTQSFWSEDINRSKILSANNELLFVGLCLKVVNISDSGLNIHNPLLLPNHTYPFWSILIAFI